MSADSVQVGAKATADTILELAVGLAPVPDFTESARNGAATFTSILVDNLDDEGDVVWGDNPFAVGGLNVHQNERNRIFF